MKKVRYNYYNNDISKRWYITYPVIKNGKLKSHRKYIESKKYPTVDEKHAFAKEFIADMEQRIENNDLIDITSNETPKEIPTLESAITNIISIFKQTLADNTLNSYKCVLKNFLKFVQEGEDSGILVNNVTTAHVHEFLDFKVSEGQLCISSRNRYLRTLKASFELMREREIIEINPARTIKGIRNPGQKSHQPYTMLEATQILNYLRKHDPQLFVFVSIIFHTFLRPIEICRMRVNDIDFDNQRIHVSKENSKTRIAKNPRFSKQLLQILREYLVEPNFGDLFISVNGAPGMRSLNVDHIRYRYNKALKAINLDGKGHTLYSWKHTGNIELYKQCKDVKYVQFQNGHTSLSMTDQYLRNLGLMMDDSWSYEMPDLQFEEIA
ncbi:site-specific integrase [Persicobacter sp. CCB-QB2]|uniref:tyrosine-type recombinase/integrase n=1 Tax=Persicobacter sp. CCB-QB2 TaxID=1561025 RepID=UPI0006A9DCA1|nr:site-specific integrase [Persicobacter sp. CCB-QB2]